jgi:hypothetical protein
MRLTVTIPAVIESFRGARLRLIAERARHADARAEVVAEQFVDNVAHQNGHRTDVPCELVDGGLADRSSLFLRAHVDLDGDGQVSRGDLLSQRAYRVPDDSETITVMVEQVGR